MVKKNVIENMVPIIIALKHKLETARSPLLKELMIYLKDLMKDYKNEVECHFDARFHWGLPTSVVC